MRLHAESLAHIIAHTNHLPVHVFKQQYEDQKHTHTHGHRWVSVPPRPPIRPPPERLTLNVPLFATSCALNVPERREEVVVEEEVRG